MAIPRNLSDLANQVDSSGTLGVAGGGTGLTTVGTNGQVLSSDGTNAVWTSLSSGSLLRMTVFTSSGTWTKGAGTNYILVRGVGGGGGGGGVRASVAGTGSGGGGGGYFEEIIDVSAVSTVAVTIGSGGLGVSAGAGNAGGTTSFGAYASGNGGGGGALEQGGGGSGGTATGGDINITGQRGSIGTWTNDVPGGLGGSSMLGLGGGMRSSTQTGAGYSGTGYGAGGSGGATSSGGGGTAASTGGAGSGGIVIVYEYA